MFSLSLTPDTRQLDRFALSLGRTLDAPLAGDSPLKDGVYEAGEVYLGAMRQRFRAEGNGTWAPLAISTQRRRGGVGLPHRKLYVTGRLYSSLVRGEAGNVFDMQADRLRVGTSVPYAKFHQRGTSRMPARTILVNATADVLDGITRSITAGFRQTINEHALSARNAA